MQGQIYRFTYDLPSAQWCRGGGGTGLATFRKLFRTRDGMLMRGIVTHAVLGDNGGGGGHSTNLGAVYHL